MQTLNTELTVTVCTPEDLTPEVGASVNLVLSTTLDNDLLNLVSAWPVPVVHDVSVWGCGGFFVARSGARHTVPEMLEAEATQALRAGRLASAVRRSAHEGKSVPEICRSLQETFGTTASGRHC